MENTNYALETLNAIGSEWAAQFDNKPELALSFQVNQSGTLTLNGAAVCPVTEIDFSSVYIGVETFGFFTETGDELRFHVDWPYESAPQVTRFSRVTIKEYALEAAAV